MVLATIGTNDDGNKIQFSPHLTMWLTNSFVDEKILKMKYNKNIWFHAATIAVMRFSAFPNQPTSVSNNSVDVAKIYYDYPEIDRRKLVTISNLWSREYGIQITRNPGKINE